MIIEGKGLDKLSQAEGIRQRESPTEPKELSLRCQSFVWSSTHLRQIDSVGERGILFLRQRFAYREPLLAASGGVAGVGAGEASNDRKRWDLAWTCQLLCFLSWCDNERESHEHDTPTSVTSVGGGAYKIWKEAVDVAPTTRLATLKWGRSDEDHKVSW